MSDVQVHSTYNLPWGYEDNHVVLLARDPHLLYTYWEISLSKKNSFIEQFGWNLWEKSVPVLKVTNVSNNTNFYVRINETAGSRYIEVPEADSLYTAELGRRVSEAFFIPLASSNYTYTPNDSLSTNTAPYFVNYKDLKSGSLDLESHNIYEHFTSKTDFRLTVGISSPELLGFVMEQSASGISSAELFGIHLQNYPGISSEAFIK